MYGPAQNKVIVPCYYEYCPIFIVTHVSLIFWKIDLIKYKKSNSNFWLFLKELIISQEFRDTVSSNST